MKKVKNSKEMHQALHKFAEFTAEEFSKVVKQCGFELYSQMSILTPKDTGWASQHWSISLVTNEEEAITIATLLDFKIGDTIHVFNNVPYIKRLDEGWSSQRPIGFSHLGMAFVTGRLNDRFEAIKRERSE
jgi:hypothetical protein